MMTKLKTRLTVTVDPELIEAGHAAVRNRRASSLSAWVNAALANRVARDRRLGALGAAIADYEAEFGTIGDDELARQARADRASAVVIRGRRPSGGARRRALRGPA